MGNGKGFQTERFRQHADRTYGRMSQTTLRRTGLEDVLRKATERNLAVLEKEMKAVEFRELKNRYGPEGIWKEVQKRGLADKNTKEIIVMSLGNPSAYTDYPPNKRVIECMAQLASMDEETVRGSAGYTHSFGYPPLLEKLKRVNFSNPQSVHNDPDKFKDVKVYVTAGGSYAAELAMGPAILAPGEDTAVVHDWTYIIHLGAAYYRDAHIESYECRDDGRPDSDSLREVLSKGYSHGHKVQAVVFTPIGNPVGAAMTRADIIDHLNIISEAGTRKGRPVIAIIDVAYEAFRRDGKPLDPIAIAIEERIKVPVIVLDTSSKGYGTCGWRLGKLAARWPEDYFPEHREDYFTSLDNKMLPTLSVVGLPLQMAYNNFFNMLGTDPAVMEETLGFFSRRRELINTNLVRLAEALREIPGVYLAKYYDHAGKNAGIEPDTLSSFYLLFGFTKLGERYGSGFNQAVDFGNFALDTPDVPIINCVPGQSFLPEKRWAKHPGLIRVTGLTNEEETAGFLKAVEAYAKNLG